MRPDAADRLSRDARLLRERIREFHREDPNDFDLWIADGGLLSLLHLEDIANMARLAAPDRHA